MNRYVLARLPISPKGEVPFGVVRAINGVADLVHVCGAPIIVPDMDVERIKKREEEGAFDGTVTKKKGTTTFVSPKWAVVGATVSVVDGPFASFMALIEEILPQNRLKIAVSIFGRETPVEMELAQVQAGC